MQDAQSMVKHVNARVRAPWPVTLREPLPPVFPWAAMPVVRPEPPRERARLVAVASLSRGIGRTTVSQALAQALAADGEPSVIVRLDTRHHHARVPSYEDRSRATTAPLEADATALEGLLAAHSSGAMRPAHAVLDLPPNPCVEWARGLEAADDVLVLVHPGRDDLATLGFWYQPHLSRVRLVASRVDDLRAEDRRGLQRLREIAGERLLEMNLHENATVARLGADAFSAAPTSPWSEEVKRLAAWVRGG